MSTKLLRRGGLHSLLWSLAVVIILADQATKAYFVWLLGNHQHTDFLQFAREYFTIFVTGSNDGGIVANYAVFAPKIWVWKPWIAWNLTTNTGAAWSIFAGNSYLLSFVSLAMAALLWVIWWRKFRFHTPMTWALGAIIGGALGNFFDRFRLHEVVDFIDVNIPWIGRLIPSLGDPYNFPIFNVADSAAVCGTLALAIYLIASDFKGMGKKKKAGEMKIQPFPEGPGYDANAKAKAREMAEQYRERTAAEAARAAAPAVHDGQAEDEESAAASVDPTEKTPDPPVE